MSASTRARALSARRFDRFVHVATPRRVRWLSPVREAPAAANRRRSVLSAEPLTRSSPHTLTRSSPPPNRDLGSLRGLGPRPTRSARAPCLVLWVPSMVSDAEWQQNAPGPGQDATPAGRGAIHGAVGVVNRWVPSRA